MIQHGGHENHFNLFPTNSLINSTISLPISTSVTINHHCTSVSSSQSSQSISSASSIINQSISTASTTSSSPLPLSPSVSINSHSPLPLHHRSISASQRKLTNFTIESILNHVDKVNSISTSTSSSLSPSPSPSSPTLPRNRKCFKVCHRSQSTDHNHLSKGNRFNNNNNRGPRIPFTSHQVQILEKKFSQTNYLSSYEVWSLSEQLNISENRVKIWFQNRRARRKREERLPEEINKQLTEDDYQTTNGKGTNNINLPMSTSILT